MATIVPSEDRDTDHPELSPAASPSISAPSCTQVPELSSYTLTWPASLPLPSFFRAPMATIVPSEDRDTEYPEWSFAASPSISAPSCTQVPELSSYTLTWPASLPLSSLFRAPMATISPSEDRDTDHPEPSYAASPSISAPICIWAEAGMDSISTKSSFISFIWSLA